MFLAFVMAMGGVGFEDVAVSGFQLFKDIALVHYSGTTVVGETAKQDWVLAILGIQGTELPAIYRLQPLNLTRLRAF